ncbi:xanthine dehydrogenase family protein subunit M [Clostridia bacterium OttesenSCG-928-O13]|nr:xanthine dehydrogenase family protein subunit M [Clostridia bacterium OttesenSCG-928-O13]
MESFEYLVAGSVDETLHYLREGKARLIAGGTDVLVQMQEDLIAPDVLVDVSRIDALKTLKDEKDALVIGAGVTHSQMVKWAKARPPWHALAQASASVGTPQVRNIATVVGNLCNAVPSADLAGPCLLYGAVVHIAGAAGTRQVPLASFFTGPKKTVLAQNEMVTHLVLAAPPAHSASNYQKLGPRKASDLAMVGVAALVALDGTGLVSTLRLGLNAVAPTPILVEKCAGATGRPFDAALAADCALWAAEQAKPITDYRASAEYRRDMVAVLTQRALSACATQLGKGDLP